MEKNVKKADLYNRVMCIACVKHRGVDLEGDYWKQPEFEQLKREMVAGTYGWDMAWMVEKTLVGQKRLEEIYGPYWLGIERKLTPEECRQSAWFKSLCDWEERQNDKAVSEENVWKYFFRDGGEKNPSQMGLVPRLKRWGFDVDAFIDERDEQSKIKLLYFLYCFENKKREDGKTVRLTKLLENPITENVDDSIVGRQTKNGELMQELKCHIAREVPEDCRERINEDFFKMGNNWKNFLKWIQLWVEASKDGSSLPILYGVRDELKKVADEMLPGARGAYQAPILSSFYLKLSEHEQLGCENDLMDAGETLPELPKLTFRLEEYRKLEDEQIPKEKAETWLRNKKERLLPLIYETDPVTKQQEKDYDKAVESVIKLISVSDFNTASIGREDLPGLWLVAAMQVLTGEERKEKPKINYYRHQTSERRTLENEAKDGLNSRTKSQLIMLRRVNHHYHVCLGLEKEDACAFEIEKIISRFHCRELEANSLDEMEHLHNEFIEIIWQIPGKNILVS